MLTKIVNGVEVIMSSEEEEEYISARVPTLGQLVSQYTRSLEVFYDTQAQSRRYDNRLTCALRAGYAGPFQAEGTAFAIWMDDCNAYSYTVMAAVEGGSRAMPTIEQLISELPTLVWPGG